MKRNEKKAGVEKAKTAISSNSSLYKGAGEAVAFLWTLSSTYGKGRPRIIGSSISDAQVQGRRGRGRPRKHKKLIGWHKDAEDANGRTARNDNNNDHKGRGSRR